MRFRIRKKIRNPVALHHPAIESRLFSGRMLVLGDASEVFSLSL